MFRFISLLLLATSVSASAREGRVLLEELAVEDPLTVVQFQSWAAEHGKEYETSDDEVDRFLIWKRNDEKIQEHNNKVPAPKFTLGHNAFSDMNQDEFHQHYSLGKYSLNKPENDVMPSFEMDEEAADMARLLRVKSLDLPDYVNWLAVGAVTPPKDQKTCGSCWAFSTTGALEGSKFIKTGELVALSEQNLLDCDHKDLGCSGGLMDNAFKFDEKSGGLCSEADYPYKAKVGKCLTNCTDVPGSIVKSFVDVPPGDEKALLSAIALQPVSIAVQADQFVFQFYKNGVIDDDTCGARGDIDHGVLAVGYATDLETQEPYWLVKNSWGATWGDNGYLKMSRKSKNKYGMCAILKMASFPVVE